MAYCQDGYRAKNKGFCNKNALFAESLEVRKKTEYHTLTGRNKRTVEWARRDPGNTGRGFAYKKYFYQKSKIGVAK